MHAMVDDFLGKKYISYYFLMKKPVYESWVVQKYLIIASINLWVLKMLRLQRCQNYHCLNIFIFKLKKKNIFIII